MTRSDFMPSPGLRIWAKDTSELYFAGRNGSVMAYKNGEWKSIPAATGNAGDAESIFGTASDNIFLTILGRLGYSNVCFRYDGKGWRTIWDVSMPSLSPTVYFGLPICMWGDKTDDSIWVAGLWLGRMRKDGMGTIRAIEDLDPDGFYRIHGSARNNVFFCGDDGLLLHYNGSTLHRYTEFKGKGIRLMAVACLEDDVFIVGDRYFGGGIFIHGKRIR